VTDVPESGSTTRWDRRKELTLRRLLTVAETLFKTQGFESTTVEEIAAAADVAKGTFFNYFISKEALLGELLYARIEPLLLTLPEANTSADARIWRLLTSVREELAPYVHLFPRMFSYALSHPDLQTTPGDHLTLGQAIAKLIVQGQEERLFRPRVNAEIAGGLIATYFFRLSVVECVRGQEHGFCWEDQMRQALDILYSGLGVDGSGPGSLSGCGSSASFGQG
jgi:AcrR family transcriptional regulator